jgi:hypothetical protein
MEHKTERGSVHVTGKISPVAGLFESTDPAACGLPAEWELDFWVPGKPQTAGSKSAIPGKGPGGRPLVVDSGDRVAKRAWRADLRAKAEDSVFEVDAPAGPWPTGEPLAVVFTFVRRRAKSHYGSGANAAVLKASAPRWPTTRPDALKLARAAEDALTGILWADDAQIVDERLEKVFGDAEGCRVRVRRLR